MSLCSADSSVTTSYQSFLFHKGYCGPSWQNMSSVALVELGKNIWLIFFQTDTKCLMVKDQQLVTSHCTSQKELCLFVFVFQFVIVGFDIFVSTAVHIVELSTTGNVRSWLWSIGQLTKSRWGFVVSEGNYTALHTHSTLPSTPPPASVTISTSGPTWGLRLNQTQTLDTLSWRKLFC